MVNHVIATPTVVAAAAAAAAVAPVVAAASAKVKSESHTLTASPRVDRQVYLLPVWSLLSLLFYLSSFPLLPS